MWLFSTRWRAFLIGPVACTLIGAALGICAGMLYHQYPLERAHVDLDDSMPLFIRGAILGCIAGAVVFAICERWTGLLPAASVLALILLGATATAPFGWIIGDMREDQQPRKGMIYGAAIGAVIGLTLGLIQQLFDRLIKSWRGERPHN
jgi:hypothetical protein